MVIAKRLCHIHDEKTPSLVVYADGHWYCYGCGAWGKNHELGIGTRKQKLIVNEPQEINWKPIEWDAMAADAYTARIPARLHKWRGYPMGFCLKLVERGIIGAFENQIAFPIRQNGKVVRAHVRKSENIDWKARRESEWFYYPKCGASADAMFIPIKCGTLNMTGVNTHIFESPWDLLSVYSSMECSDMSQFIATRGSCNSKKLGSIALTDKVYIWPQNDDWKPNLNDRPGRIWLKHVKKYLPSWCDCVTVEMPDGIKDANDLLKSGVNPLELIK